MLITARSSTGVLFSNAASIATSCIKSLECAGEMGFRGCKYSNYVLPCDMIPQCLLSRCFSSKTVSNESANTSSYPEEGSTLPSETMVHITVTNTELSNNYAP